MSSCWTMSPFLRAEAVGLEPTSDLVAACFRDRFLIQPDDFRNLSAAEVGIEPTPRRSERPILPLDDPAVIVHVHQSCGGRNRTCVRAVNSRLPVPARVPPQNRPESRGLRLEEEIELERFLKPQVSRLKPRRVRTAGFEPAVSCARSTRIARLSHVLNQERPAGVEPARPPWQGGRQAATSWARFAITELSKSQSTGWDSNPRRRITGAESWPLDDQCLLFSGTGGHRTHIVRFKRPVHYLVCHSPEAIGAVGVEPTACAL